MGKDISIIFLAILFLLVQVSQRDSLNELQSRMSYQESKLMEIRNEVEELKTKADDLRGHIQYLREQVEEIEPCQFEQFEATAYSHGCGTGDGYTATMTRPQEGRTIAVDPEVIPLGSDVWVEGWGWMVAEDTGGVIKGNIIDIFVDDVNQAWSWGRRDVNVYVRR